MLVSLVSLSLVAVLRLGDTAAFCFKGGGTPCVGGIQRKPIILFGRSPDLRQAHDL